MPPSTHPLLPPWTATPIPSTPHPPTNTLPSPPPWLTHVLIAWLAFLLTTGAVLGLVQFTRALPAWPWPWPPLWTPAWLRPATRRRGEYVALPRREEGGACVTGGCAASKDGKKLGKGKGNGNAGRGQSFRRRKPQGLRIDTGGGNRGTELGLAVSGVEAEEVRTSWEAARSRRRRGQARGAWSEPLASIPEFAALEVPVSREEGAPAPRGSMSALHVDLEMAGMTVSPSRETAPLFEWPSASGELGKVEKRGVGWLQAVKRGVHRVTNRLGERPHDVGDEEEGLLLPVREWEHERGGGLEGVRVDALGVAPGRAEG